MLFNSYTFICFYLPITLLAFFSLGAHSQRLAALWLTGASFLFYAWWSPAYVFLLMGSIIFNYAAGMALARSYEEKTTRLTSNILLVGVSANLLLLAYYKYANFLVTNLNDALGTGFFIAEIILPIGISFFTFTQIAFLVDASRGLAREYDFIHYCMFVTYFPHLIAGPVLHHSEMMPQFARPQTYKLNYDNLAIGMTLFIFGLFKKLVLADNISVYATPVFNAAATGATITFLEAWGGALSYTLQLYFDFSGYTDMAIGLSRMFGVRLPINFYSPYQAPNIIEFWRRWHMTLSRFLRDYLYIPLGGNRKGNIRRHVNILVTMLLGGLWHGANWTFVAWGGLHGIYLVINHAWRGLRTKLGVGERDTRVYRSLCCVITFVAVVVAWVFFRSDSIHAALGIVRGMLGWNGLSLPVKWIENPESGFLVQWFLDHGAKISDNSSLFAGATELRLIAALLAVCWFLPNTQDVIVESGRDRRAFWRWQPNGVWAAITIAMGFFSFLSISELSEFIYFQF